MRRRIARSTENRGGKSADTAAQLSIESVQASKTLLMVALQSPKKGPNFIIFHSTSTNFAALASAIFFSCSRDSFRG